MQTVPDQTHALQHADVLLDILNLTGDLGIYLAAVRKAWRYAHKQQTGKREAESQAVISTPVVQAAMASQSCYQFALSCGLPHSEHRVGKAGSADLFAVYGAANFECLRGAVEGDNVACFKISQKGMCLTVEECCSLMDLCLQHRSQRCIDWLLMHPLQPVYAIFPFIW